MNSILFHTKTKNKDFDWKRYINKNLSFYKSINKIDFNFKVLKDSNNKPYFQDNKYYISLSHTKRKEFMYYTVALSTSPIGVDIQDIVDIDYEKIMYRIFNEKELKLTRSREDFFNIFSKKEAKYKSLINQDNITLATVDTTKEDKKQSFFVFKAHESIIISVYGEVENLAIIYN